MQNQLNLDNSTLSNSSSYCNPINGKDANYITSHEKQLNNSPIQKKFPNKQRNKRRKTKLSQKISICHFYPCMKKFTSRENLDIHISNIHLKQKPFECNYCEFKFSHLSGRIYHERTQHLKYLPFVCKYESKD